MILPGEIGTVTLKLPATSANLGPGFDALGLAMDFHLHVEARAASRFAIKASGRSAAKIAEVDDSLIVETYRSVLGAQRLDPPPLELRLRNEIPLGMGCGSSAAALVAGVGLANHFGRLGWSRQQVVTEASLREGHPDNVAACVLGALTVSAMRSVESGPAVVSAVALEPAVSWPLLLVMPEASLSTTKARALLPAQYSKADAIANVQGAALVTAAFASGRGDLLASAMGDRMHQPYRSAACPLLPVLLPLAGQGDALGVALSGAGPSVLLVLRAECDRGVVERQVRAALAAGGFEAELLFTEIGGGAVLA